MAPQFSHLGICVSDLARSLRFYTEGLGFEVGPRYEIGDEFGAVMELDDVKLTVQFVEQGDVHIELLHFESPGPSGSTERRPMNQFGLTHLSFQVDDVEAVAAKLVALGGRAYPATRVTVDEVPAAPGAGEADYIYCTDPDGTRIEVMHNPT